MLEDDDVNEVEQRLLLLVRMRELGRCRVVNVIEVNDFELNRVVKSATTKMCRLEDDLRC